MAAQSPTFGFLLHDVARLLRHKFDQRACALGLTRAQWQVLAHLARHEGIHQRGLAEILEVTDITLGRLIDRLEQAGWVERRPHPSDRRARLLYLTERSMPILEQMRSLGEETREEALAGLTAEDRNQLMQSLSMIRNNLSRRCADD